MENSAHIPHVFLPVPVGPALCRVRDEGVAVIPSLIDPAFLAVLNGEVHRMALDRAEGVVGVVEQRFDRAAFFGAIEGLPLLEAFRCAAGDLIRTAAAEAHMAPLAAWEAKDTIVQKYGLQGGIGSHRDLARHPGVVMIATIAGSARFMLHGDTRDGAPIAVHEPRAGDVMLLRGPGLRGGAGGGTDERPFHSVSGALGPEPRISISFRDNLDPEKLLRGFSYRNR